MNPVIAQRIPLVCRTKPPGLSLQSRLAELTALTNEPPGADHHQRVARASGVLNFAALIASDTGLPDLAADLCWRQHKIFTEGQLLTRAMNKDTDHDIAVMALMPLVNIARLLIRQGDGHAAYELLHRLYRAAQQRDTTTIRDHEIDLAPLIHTPADHRTICTELWMALLIDGARALARDGRWTEAAEAMAAHRGIGNRLLDGRQLKIMALLQEGLTEQAITVIDSTIPTEPWENTVANLLRIACRPGTSPSPRETSHVVEHALDLINQPEPMTAAFRARTGLTTLDLTAEHSKSGAAHLRSTVIKIASSDAYAARDVLNHQPTRSQMTGHQEQQLLAVLTASALGAKTLPPQDMDALTGAVHTAENRLRDLLDE